MLSPLALLAWKIGWSALFGNLAESPRLGYRCLWIAMTMGAVRLALLAMTRRAAEPRHPGLLGAAMGGVGSVFTGWQVLLNTRR